MHSLRSGLHTHKCIDTVSEQNKEVKSPPEFPKFWGLLDYHPAYILSLKVGTPLCNLEPQDFGMGHGWWSRKLCQRL